MLEGQQRPHLHNHQDGEHREGDNADPEYSKPKTVVFLRTKGEAHYLMPALLSLLSTTIGFLLPLPFDLRSMPNDAIAPVSKDATKVLSIFIWG